MVDGEGYHTESNFRNLTVTKNTAFASGGGIYFESTPQFDIQSNVVAGNTSANGPRDLVLQSSDGVTFENNFIGSNDGTDLNETGLDADPNGNLVGSEAAIIEPLLGDLTDFGNQQAHIPLTGSPLLNAGSNPGDVDADQLGNQRELDGGVDIGSVEVRLSPLQVTDVTQVESDSGATDFVFTVEMTEAASGPFTVDAATIDGTAVAGSDFTGVTETLSFDGTPGQQLQVTVQVTGDTSVERNETFLLRFSNSSDQSIQPPGDATGTITNDDQSDNIRIDSQTLRVEGTPEADEVTIELVADAFIRVTLNDEVAEFENTDFLNGEVKTFAGDDNVNVLLASQPMLIEVGDGADTVKGGLGNDRILGGAGNDRLRGTQGNDTIFGGIGDDSLLGQVGNDLIRGENGDDTLKGLSLIHI